MVSQCGDSILLIWCLILLILGVVYGSLRRVLDLSFLCLSFKMKNVKGKADRLPVVRLVNRRLISHCSLVGYNGIARNTWCLFLTEGNGALSINRSFVMWNKTNSAYVESQWFLLRCSGEGTFPPSPKAYLCGLICACLRGTPSDKYLMKRKWISPFSFGFQSVLRKVIT